MEPHGFSLPFRHPAPCFQRKGTNSNRAPERSCVRFIRAAEMWDTRWAASRIHKYGLSVQWPAAGQAPSLAVSGCSDPPGCPKVCSLNNSGVRRSPQRLSEINSRGLFWRTAGMTEAQSQPNRLEPSNGAIVRLLRCAGPQRRAAAQQFSVCRGLDCSAGQMANRSRKALSGSTPMPGPVGTATRPPFAFTCS